MAPGNAQTIAVCLDHLYPDRHAFAAQFYRQLFARLPAARKLYAQEPRRREIMLFATVSMMAKGLASGRDLSAELMTFGRIHRRAGLGEEAFALFGRLFLEALIAYSPGRDHVRLARAWWAIYDEICPAIGEGMRTEPAARPDTRPRLFAHPAATRVARVA